MGILVYVDKNSEGNHLNQMTTIFTALIANHIIWRAMVNVNVSVQGVLEKGKAKCEAIARKAWQKNFGQEAMPTN